MVAPDRFDRAQMIVGDLAALFAVDAQDFVFTRLDCRRRADADADVEPALAKNIESCQLFGGQQGIAAGDDDAGDAEANFA